jgi:hypothetical protein
MIQHTKVHEITQLFPPPRAASLPDRRSISPISEVKTSSADKWRMSSKVYKKRLRFAIALAIRLQRFNQLQKNNVQENHTCDANRCQQAATQGSV